MVSFKWRTTARSRAKGYRRRTTVMGFKWKTLVMRGLLQVNDYNSWFQMKNGCGFPLRTTVVTLQMENCSIRL